MDFKIPLFPYELIYVFLNYVFLECFMLFLCLILIICWWINI